MIAFVCSECGKSLKVKDEFAGRKGRCPHCQKPMMVPAVADSARENTEKAGNDNHSGTNAKTILPSSLDAERDSRAILPSVPRGKTGMKKGSTVIPDAPSPSSDAELYDFLSPAQAPDEIGRLGSYRVLKVLGAGGMGVVFQAEDPKLNRLVALKAMLPALAASGTSKDRFLREARAAAAIEHDHIIPIFQVDEDHGVPFIAMPFLRGESLEDRLRRQRPLSLDEVLRITREIAEGLAAAHDRNMIHRDIKPANIWLEGEKGRVKILDFGLARSASGESNLTQQGAIVGTPAYMAPEQGAGKPVDTRCDLFSLGCVMYRMVTGTFPFRGTDTVSMLVAVATETPKAPRKLNPAVPPRLSKLIMELLAKDPQDRPPSAQSVMEHIEELEKEPSSETTEFLDESPRGVRSSRDDDFDEDTVRALDDEELDERPAKRSLMVPLLLGGVLGGFFLLVIGVVVLVVVLRKNEKEDLAQIPSNPPVEVTSVKPPPLNPNPLPRANLNPNPNVPAGGGFQGDKVNPGNLGGVNDPANDNNNVNPIRIPPRRRPRRNEAQDAEIKFKRYNSAAKGLTFAPDGKHFFSFGERESRVDMWELETGKIVRSFPFAGKIQHLAVSADGSRLLAYNSSGLLCWDVDGGRTLPVTPPLGTTIVGGGFTADKNVCAALCEKRPDGSAVYIYNHALGNLLPLLDPQTKKPVLNRKSNKPVPQHFAHPGTEVQQVFFSSNGKQFLSWSKDNTFRGWDTEDPSRTIQFPVAPGESKSIAVSPDFKRVMASFPGHPEFHVYDTAAGKALTEIKPDGVGSTDAVAFGGDNNVGVAARFGGPTRIYDLEQGTIKKEVKGIAFTTSIALAPNNKIILCGDMSGTIHVFKADE